MWFHYWFPYWSRCCVSFFILVFKSTIKQGYSKVLGMYACADLKGGQGGSDPSPQPGNWNFIKFTYNKFIANISLLQKYWYFVISVEQILWKLMYKQILSTDVLLLMKTKNGKWCIEFQTKCYINVVNYMNL